MKIAIVGGGISGLATAFHLTRLLPAAEIALFERAPHPGGTMHTVEREGFRFEAGGNGFLTNKPHTLALVQATGAEDLLLRSSDAARRRFIFDGALHRLPESPPAFLGSRLLTLPAKLRVLAEVFIPPRRDGGEETLQSFGYRRLGRAFTDTFLDAMTAGIYASTPADLSVQAAFPAVAALEREHGGLFRGMLARRRREAGPGGVLMSFRGGVGSFIDHLAGLLGERVRTGSPVTALARTAAGWRLEAGDVTYSADRLVLACPAHAAAALLEPVDAGLAAELAAIHYAPIAVVGLGYRGLDHPLDGFGLLTTSAARLPILGVLWDSSIFPDRAPEGGQTLRVMIGGLRNPELALLSEAELVRTALRGVGATMGCRAEPEVTFVQRWERGIPSYRIGHLGRLERIFTAAAALPGLYLVSNAYRGIALNDCAASALACAGELAAGRPQSVR